MNLILERIVKHFCCNNYLYFCGVLNLAGCHSPTQPLSHFLSASGWEGEIRWKNLWVEVKTRRALTSYCHGQNRFSSRKINFIYCQLK